MTGMFPKRVMEHSRAVKSGFHLRDFRSMAKSWSGSELVRGNPSGSTRTHTRVKVTRGNDPWVSHMRHIFPLLPHPNIQNTSSLDVFSVFSYVLLHCPQFPPPSEHEKHGRNDCVLYFFPHSTHSPEYTKHVQSGRVFCVLLCSFTFSSVPHTSRTQKTRSE